MGHHDAVKGRGKGPQPRGKKKKAKKKETCRPARRGRNSWGHFPHVRATPREPKRGVHVIVTACECFPAGCLLSCCVSQCFITLGDSLTPRLCLLLFIFLVLYFWLPLNHRFCNFQAHNDRLEDLLPLLRMLGSEDRVFVSGRAPRRRGSHDKPTPRSAADSCLNDSAPKRHLTWPSSQPYDVQCSLVFGDLCTCSFGGYHECVRCRGFSCFLFSLSVYLFRARLSPKTKPSG